MLNSKRKDISNLKVTIKSKEKELHTLFVKENKRTFKILDTLFILMFVFNMVALFTTNMMVAKTTEQFVEVNLISAEMNNYETHPDEATKHGLFNGLLFRLFYWSMLISMYVIFRRNIKTENQLTILMAIVLVWFAVMSWDVINNLGYVFGRLIWT